MVEMKDFEMVRWMVELTDLMRVNEMVAEMDSLMA